MHLYSVWFRMKWENLKNLRNKAKDLNWKLRLWGKIRDFLICWVVPCSMALGPLAAFKYLGVIMREMLSGWHPFPQRPMWRSVKITLKELWEFLWIYLRCVLVFPKQSVQKIASLRNKTLSLPQHLARTTTSLLVIRHLLWGCTNYHQWKRVWNALPPRN